VGSATVVQFIPSHISLPASLFLRFWAFCARIFLRIFASFLYRSLPFLFYYGCFHFLVFSLSSVASSLRSLVVSSDAPIFEVVVSRLDDTYLVQTPHRQLGLQNVPDQFDDVLPGGRESRQRRVAIEITMIEPLNNPLVDQLVETSEVTSLFSFSALYSDQHDIVMPMPVRIITFSERRPVLFGRQLVRVKPVCGAKPIAPCHIDL